MWVSELKLANVRGFSEETIHFSETVNVLVGENNGGKSTILKALLLLQDTTALARADLRIGTESGEATITFNGGTSDYYGTNFSDFRVRFPDMKRSTTPVEGMKSGFKELTQNEPNNFIYPHSAKRKVTSYIEAVNQTNANTVDGKLGYLYSKIDRVSNSEYKPMHEKYMQACDEVLGFRVTAVPSDEGKQAAYIIQGRNHIPLVSMGEGVPQVLGLIVDLCEARNKLFLLEEPENDLHPQALKRLLELVVEASEHNQFIITTHSNIVVGHLGAEEGGKVFCVRTGYEDRLPKSTVDEVSEPGQRREMLEEMGYALGDFDLPEAWVFLEESSAEMIIRDHLIPWFVPEMQRRVKTYAAGGINKVKQGFESFNRLFVFLHLAETYKNRAWVIVDSGDEAGKVIEELKGLYSPRGWNENHFTQFEKDNFEKYYPATFKGEVSRVLGIQDRKQRQDEKKALRQSVEDWIESNGEVARSEFESSAIEVIDKLKEIARELDLGGE